MKFFVAVVIVLLLLIYFMLVVLRSVVSEVNQKVNEYFLEKIPFSIFINNKEFEINDIYCVDIEHVGIEGRGIDVSFDIFVNYDFLSEEFREKDTNVLVNKIESLETNHVNEQDFEQLKSLETNRVDDLLKTTLIGKDNSPT